MSDTASHSTQDLALYSLDVGTGVRRRLTDPPRGKSDVIPTYPPDGKKLAFCRIGENGQGDVFVMPTSGGPAKQLTSDNKTLTGLAWTVDGHALIRVSNRDGSYRLWRQLAEPGGQPERVEGLEGSVYDVAVGGNRLAYRGASFIDVNIWRYGAPPTTAPGVPLIASADLENDARYSPDGSRIAFASARSEGRAQIWSCGGDGSNPRQLTSFGPDHGTTGSPAWSPDGKLIAFDTRPPGSSSSIFVIDADGGGQPRRLTGPGSTNFIPAWSSDGRFIYFGSDRSGPVEIWRLPVSGGTPEQVTRHGGFEVFLTADGRFLYYTKGHEREGMWRMPIEGGEEEFLPELKPVARHRYWHGARDGIYFLDFSDSVPVPTIRLFRFSGRKVTTVLTAPAPPVPRFRGLTFTPDGRSFLYMQYDVRRSAVMLVNGFR